MVIDRASVEVDASPEHGDTGRYRQFDFDDVRSAPQHVLGVRGLRGLGLRLTNFTDAPARLMLLGGEPFDEGIVMWWNFIGRPEHRAHAAGWNDAPDDR